ncbi:hypothetical protein PHLGIDRAFT_130067 [Phlebiopsis gigantea 11061_1 CR5-6]|uniref:Uncharacterized protein n=1 Tax=Phlebiopsis gigantea (strain 11061_1 CR5-6) TaxID=745531 RepID=A0A0C3S5H7_PHLG1|nr:hypothetical protein PHLGIDRAFT_130067 [Phlebiopsis gigantea 11061_1 CR5-6]
MALHPPMAAFLVSRTSSDASIEQSLASLGITNDDDDDSSAAEGSTNSRGVQIVSDVLSKGLSVKVNGTPWQRVLMKIDDEADQAVIILFGLMPNRQYDIELGIVPTEGTVRSQIMTDRAPEPDGSADAALVTDIAEQSDQALSLAASAQSDVATLSGPAHSMPADAPAPSFSLEDRRLQLTHTLSLLTAEHTTLTSTLKAARKDSQKADAALRAEIDALKRASERTAPGELRARQKARALQEAARQALAAAEQVQERVQELEVALPELLRQRESIEREWERVRAEADAVRRRREEAEAQERKRIDAKQTELAALAGRMERLSTRREKLEGAGGTLADLEEKLRRLESERERVESDPYGYSFEDPGELEFEAGHEDGFTQTANGSARSHSHANHSSHQQVHPRKRHSHPSTAAVASPQAVSAATAAHPRTVPIPISRPDPIQRPGQLQAGRTSLSSGPGVIHLQPGMHTHSNTLPPTVKRTPPSNADSTSTSGSSSNPSPAPPSASNLSTRAPPFEPRGIKSELNPGSSPFAPRGGALTPSAQTQAEATKKAPGTGRP